MRDKTKVNFTGQLKFGTMAKLMKISGDMGLSKTGAVEYLIENYNIVVAPVEKVIESPKADPKPSSTIKRAGTLTPKQSEPTLAELLKRARENKVQ